jgi:hypothetical protein
MIQMREGYACSIWLSKVKFQFLLQKILSRQTRIARRFYHSYGKFIFEIYFFYVELFWCRSLHNAKFEIAVIFVSICRRFDPGASLDRRVNCRCVSQSRWVGARWNTRGKTTARVIRRPGQMRLQ